MSDVRPDEEALRDLVVDQLGGMFVVGDIGDDGFTIEHDGVATRVRVSVTELDRYMRSIEASAYDGAARGRPASHRCQPSAHPATLLRTPLNR